jgi:glycosyltransferase involved in cell wall biosynthesis
MSSRDVPFGESCPNIVLEGMGAAKPVIGTDVGGTKELVVDGETGLVIEPDNAAHLAQALGILLKNLDLRQRMGEAGRRHVVEKFSIDQMIAGRENLFLHLMAQKRLTT